MFFVLFILNGIHGFKVPGNCASGHFYEPSLMDCLPCPANASLVTSFDGFGCSCNDHSVPSDISKCKPCNITEVVSSDGISCVPRRCQSSAGRIVCRKCPIDYISVTQNFDGSPMKEVQCIKCARGYKALNNRCVRCEACACKKHEIVIKGNCIPKKFVQERPKYSENILHPEEVLEFIKLEYLCTKGEYRACRSLASICVRNYYTSHPAGPCRLWLQRNTISFKGFPLLTTDDFKSNKAELSSSLVMNTLDITLATHSSSGGFEIFKDTCKFLEKCLSPLKIIIGSDFRRDCVMNASNLTPKDYGDIFEMYVLSQETLKSLPLIVRKPSGYNVEKGSWVSNKYRKFFLINKFLSTTTNTTSTEYLRTVLFRVRVERDIYSEGSLKLQLHVEIQYASKHPLSDAITTTLRVEHEMPDARVMRNMEILGGVLSMTMVVYGVIQCRGAIRRGAQYFVIPPLLCGCIADALYFAILFSTLHALSSEAGTLSLILPLSKDEEHLISAIMYAVITLKSLKVLWINWKQCRCDIIFIDWSLYNPSVRAPAIKDDWKMNMLVSELISMQTKRRVPPSYIVTITVLVLHLLNHYQPHVPKSQGYKWVIAGLVWWSSYCLLLLVSILIEKLFESSKNRLCKLCINLEISVLVIQDEYYGHYVNGRNDDLYMKSISHSLPCCRLIWSPQLRNAFVKLQTVSGYDDKHAKHELLSQFLGAFFERALDGLNWVASERTVLEWLLDIELIEREGGNTSVLLYDNNNTIPSLFAMTWMGEEWTLATFDAMLFGCILIASDQFLLAALLTVVIWRAMKCMRMIFSSWIIKSKI